MASLYRQKALKTLSSPEQLDRMVIITPPMVWLAIAAGIVLTVVVCVWAGVGSVYSTISCKALYFDKGQLNYIYSPVSGFVTESFVEQDKAFKKGDVLYTVRDASGKTTEIKAVGNGYPDTFAHAGYYARTGEELVRYWEESDMQGGYVYCLVPYSIAGSVKEGSKVMLDPTFLDDQYYGHMTGTVTKVGKGPVGKVELYYQVGNQPLIDEVFSEGPFVAAYCEIDKDPDSANGFRWTIRTEEM